MWCMCHVQISIHWLQRKWATERRWRRSAATTRSPDAASIGTEPPSPRSRARHSSKVGWKKNFLKWHPHVSVAVFIFIFSLKYAFLSPRIRILSQPVRGHVHPRETVGADQATRGHHQGRPIVYPLQSTHRESHVYSFCSWDDCPLSLSLSRRSGFQTEGLNGGGKPNTEVAHSVSVCVCVWMYLDLRDQVQDQNGLKWMKKPLQCIHTSTATAAWQCSLSCRPSEAKRRRPCGFIDDRQLGVSTGAAGSLNFYPEKISVFSLKKVLSHINMHRSESESDSSWCFVWSLKGVFDYKTLSCKYLKLKSKKISELEKWPLVSHAVH